MTEPTMDRVRQTIADEWGSHVCWHEGPNYDRTCDKDRHCRCADIARAILSEYSLTTRLTGCLHPGEFGCQFYGKCLSVACNHYGKTECRPRMTVLAQVDGILYPTKETR